MIKNSTECESDHQTVFPENTQREKPNPSAQFTEQVSGQATKQGNKPANDGVTDRVENRVKNKPSLLFVPRMMVTASLPCCDVNTHEFVRWKGKCTLAISSLFPLKLPYGAFPRRLLLYLSTEAKIKNSREIYLGQSFVQRFDDLSHCVSGGLCQATMLKDQTRRLFGSIFNWVLDEGGLWSVESMRVVQEAMILWESRDPKLWESAIILDERFFNDITHHAFPVSQEVAETLSRYPMAFDIYCWLNYWYSFLTQPWLITWAELESEFGTGNGLKSSFKHRFKIAIRHVHVYYPQARFKLTDQGVWLYCSRPHIS